MNYQIYDKELLATVVAFKHWPLFGILFTKD